MTVTDHSGLACSAAGGMNPNNFIHWNCEHAKGIVVAQVGFGGKWKFGQDFTSTYFSLYTLVFKANIGLGAALGLASEAAPWNILRCPLAGACIGLGCIVALY